MDDYMERVVHTFENGVMVYDDHLTPVQRERYLHRNVHEADEEDVFAKLVRSLPPNSCYINIGAAIGYYAILAKKLSPELMVHAVEPLKRHRRYFIENIALNSLTLSDINIHAVGIAAINGEAIFIDNGFGSAIGNHSDLNGVESDKVSLIKTRNLDNLLTEIPSSVELCQMDVQGHEFEVLQGARVALRDGRVSTFLIGTHGRKIHSDCARLLIENGYQVEFELIDSQLQPDGILVASKGVTRLSAPSSFKEFKPTIGKPASRNLSFCPESYAYYRDLSADGAKNKSAPFILIDSKSLPRSGLHYLKKTFSRLLDENFSFCEWYHEPGCCRKMPCTYTDYASKCHQKGMAGVRLVKSHDFDLADPEFPTLYNLRRLILVRDPLYILTSWFCLDQLELYETELSKAGINLIKIAYLHEPEVLASAFQLLEKNFCPPAKEQLADWIHKRTEYIHEFIAKWVVPATEQQQHFTNVVRYEEINQYILEILNEIREFLPEHAQRKIDDFAKHPAGYFSARGNPFQAPSAKLTAYLLENASQFKSAAESINDFWGAATQKKCALQKCRNNLPKISIVTPSYNQSEYLEECIVSVLSQNYPNLEYIIMDGGSTDGSVEIIKKYEKHLTYWQSQPDGGQYVATNEGFRRSTGEIMGWLNSDDKLHPGALHQVALAFRAMPQTEWITGRPTAWDDQGRLITVFDHVPSWSLERLLYHRKDDYYIQQESTFWRRSLWDRAGGGLDTNWQLAADFELWCRFFRYSELTGVDALFGGFRYHSGQKTDTMMDHYEQEVLQIIDRERRSPAKHNAQSRPPDVVDMGDIISAVTPELTPDAFSYFSYSRRPHFNWFAASAQKLFGSAVDPDYCDLKMYQDLLCYTFIVDNLPKSSRILEVGGGDSRVLKALKNDYECWNVDKLEGVGNGLKEVVVDGYRMVRAYLGDFSEELADGYFDLVFSISALEHVAENEENFKNICSDMDRVMKPGAFSLHCLDVVAKQDNVRTNSFMPFLFRRYKTKNQLTPFEQMVQDPSLYCMSEAAYERGWRNITKVSYKEFGRPLSCNILWQKTDDQSVSVLPSLQGMVPDLKSLIAWYYDQNKDGFTASEKALLYSAIEGPLNFLQEIEGPLFADTHTGRLVKQIMLSRHGRAIRDALPKFRPYCLNYFPQMMINILSDGAVTTCCFDAYGDNQFGSIYEKQLSDIWEHDLPRVMQGDLYDHKRCLQCIGYQGWAPLVNEEGKREEWLEWMSKTPNEIQIEITAHCNYACVFCASASIRQQRSAFLDLDKTFENIRGMLKNTHKINLYNYGEPLLHQGLSDFIHKCRAESSELILELATNGMQLNEKISRALIENRVDRIIVSVHGGPGTENMLKYSSHGADYDVVLNNVRQLLQLRKTLNSQVPKVSLRAILFHWNDNDEDMNRFRDDARALGLSATWGHYDTDNYHWILDSGSQLASKKYISGSAGLKALVASREFLSCRLYEEECKRNGDSGGGGKPKNLPR
jgi:FkbM family methyltransferase